jgi:uncharacterized membrane protein
VFKRIALLVQFLLPLVIHAAVLSGRSLAIAAALALVSFLWGWFLLAEPRRRRERLAGWALSYVVPALVLFFHAEVAVRVLMIGYPVLFYLALSWVFASTLRSGKEPLISMIARIERGRLTPEVVTYTRRLTLVWALFFAGLAAETIVLARFAPIEVWSLFANVLNDVFTLAFFVLEYAYRRYRFRHLPHPGPIELLRKVARNWSVAKQSQTLP